MKCVLMALLTLSALTTGIFTDIARVKAEPVPGQGAGLLQTQPLSINPIENSPRSATGTFYVAPYTRENLNSISASLQVRSGGRKSALPSFIPRGIDFGNSTAPASATANPTDFFRVQAPDRGVRFRVSETP